MKQEYELLKEYKDVMTPNEVKNILNIGKNAIYDLLKNERIKSLKIGSHYRITKSALLDYLQNEK